MDSLVAINNINLSPLHGPHIHTTEHPAISDCSWNAAPIFSGSAKSSLFCSCTRLLQPPLQVVLCRSVVVFAESAERTAHNRHLHVHICTLLCYDNGTMFFLIFTNALTKGYTCNYMRLRPGISSKHATSYENKVCHNFCCVNFVVDFCLHILSLRLTRYMAFSFKMSAILK